MPRVLSSSAPEQLTIFPAACRARHGLVGEEVSAEFFQIGAAGEIGSNTGNNNLYICHDAVAVLPSASLVSH